MEITRLRIGIIGAANIAERSIIPALLTLTSHYKLQGLASRSETRAQLFSSKFGTSVFDDYAKLISDPNIDCIYIPLPNALHFEWAKVALLSGKHILVEKPLCPSLDQTEDLIAIAAERGLAVLENFQYRFHPQMTTLKRLLNEGVIGELRGMYSTFAFPPFLDKSNIRYKKDLGGGAFMDAGCYPLSITYDFLGPDLKIIKSHLFYEDTFEVDIGGIAYLEEERSGRFSIVNFGFSDPYECSLELVGSRGRISSSRIFTAPSNLKATINIRCLNEEYSIVHEPDNHFIRMLEYFHTLVSDPDKRSLEYKRCADLARVREKMKANH